MSMLNRIKDLAREYERDAVALRRHFHAHPELSWQEARTTDRIEEELGKLGIPVLHRGYGGTSSGLIADIKGARPGRCVCGELCGFAKWAGGVCALSVVLRAVE